MRLIRLFSTVPALLMIVNLGNAQSAATEKNKDALIWADEFNGTGLPDASKWGYEVGFVRNNEKQYYTLNRTQNVRQEAGNLVIESLKENFQGANYTSASINTLDKKSFEGDIRVEVSAKLPQGKGIWPAIWMMGSNIKQVGWPKCGELDIMEFVGHTPGKIFGTLHWWDNASTTDDKHLSKGNNLMISDLHTAFHVYSLERKGKTISLFIDGKNLLTFSAPTTTYENTFTGPLYLLLNTAIGGSWGGDIDDSIFPQKFLIDYVRVYRL
ncbi:MAG TPA: glycoside hydrolase family 16 protein [Prolixibacteraceae bacterium]